MAQQQDQDTPKIGFKSVQLLKKKTLGIGSYGIVCMAQCDNLLCAAKIIHQTLFDPNLYEQVERNKEHRLPISRFMQECDFMSAIKHPNIVQFLGTHQDPQTDLPVLLMELMDDSLTHFLESSQDAVPYHIQVNFCHDITMVISYLHLNGITHRDLSSNNVLLYGTSKAKVTDFGMAKLGDINPQATRVSFTLCPGTDVYMPPEAVQDIPKYTVKIDCFAIGILIIQILTRCFPDPGNRLKTVQIDHPQFPGGTIYMPVSEIKRRQNHISLVDPNHLLLPIALDCLKDNDVERPSAQELCHRIAALKETNQFAESVRRAQERPEPADNTTEREEELRQQVQDKEKENHQLKREHAQQIQELQEIISSQNNQLQQKDDIISKNNDIIRDKDKNIQELEQQLKTKTPSEVVAKPQPSLRDPAPQTDTRTDTATRDSFTMRWREGKKAPCEMARGSSVVDGNVVYFRPANSRRCYAYNSRDKTWDELPQCPNTSAVLEVVQNSLTAIGGRDRNRHSDMVTNQLLSLTGEARSKRWREVFPPMPTKRSNAIAVSTGQALIVAGGRGVSQNLDQLKTVEVMDFDTRQWSSAADLPIPLNDATVTICGERVYIGGGVGSKGSTESVYTCTLADLFLSCQSTSLGERLAQSLTLTSPLTSNSTVWSKVADLPVKWFTCVTLNDRLLAMGGCDSKFTPITDVHLYHPTSDTWEVISKMNTSRWQRFAVVLPTNEVMVVGGWTAGNEETDSVEIATIV